MARHHRAPLTRRLARIALRRACGLPASAGQREGLAKQLADLPPVALADVPRLLEASGLGALVYADLPADLPSSLRAAGADLLARTRARGRRLAQDRAALSSGLQDVSVPYRPLKGAWLAPFAYATPDRRPMADTDLFVASDEWSAAQRALQRLGYRRTARTWKHEVWLKPDNRRVVEPRGEHPDNPRPVELHPRLGETFRGLSIELDRAQPGARGAHLLAHATVDMLSRRLRPIALIDVARWAMLQDDEAWQTILRTARAAGVARFLWPALALAQRELDLFLPAEPMTQLEAAIEPSLRQWTAALDLDAVGRDARIDVGRALLEVDRIWPVGTRERLRVLREQVLPGRWQLADRDPALAERWWWPWAVAQHVAGLPLLGLSRWRRRSKHPAGSSIDDGREGDEAQR